MMQKLVQARSVVLSPVSSVGLVKWMVGKGWLRTSISTDCGLFMQSKSAWVCRLVG